MPQWKVTGYTLLPDRIELPVAAKSLQSCPTLCDPIDGLLPGSSVPGILQVRTLKWVAISFSNAWKWKVKVKSLSHVWLLATPWTAAYQAPPSMGFSGQEYWNGLPLPALRIELTELQRGRTNVMETCGRAGRGEVLECTWRIWACGGWFGGRFKEAGLFCLC